MRTLIAWISTMVFVAGLSLGYVVKTNEMPGSIDVIRDGKVAASADLDIDKSRILNVTDGDDPGAYLAFPLYKQDPLEVMNQ